MRRLPDRHRYPAAQTAPEPMLRIRNRRTECESSLRSLIVHFLNARTDRAAHFLSLLGGRYLAGTDRPDWLVCDHSCLCLLCGHILECDLDLLADPVKRDALLSLGQSLAAANDRGQTVLKMLSVPSY